METSAAALIASLTALVGAAIAVARALFIEPKAATRAELAEVWAENREVRGELDKARDSLAAAWAQIDQLRSAVRAEQRAHRETERMLWVCQEDRERLGRLVGRRTGEDGP